MGSSWVARGLTAPPAFGFPAGDKKSMFFKPPHKSIISCSCYAAAAELAGRRTPFQLPEQEKAVRQESLAKAPGDAALKLVSSGDTLFPSSLFERKTAYFASLVLICTKNIL